MNELALFAGIGCGILGTQSLGLTTVCAVEIGEYQRRCLVQRQNERSLPRFPIWDDIRTFNARRFVGRIELVSGGFPCQPFSSASRGRRVALDLWPEMHRVIKEVQPNYVFAENVSKSAIERAASDCATMGYKTDALALSAKDLGADHIRERFWLLAYTDNKSKLLRTINAKTCLREEFYSGIWEAEPDQSRVADGGSFRVEQYQAIGNGQVPLVAAAALWALAHAQ